MSQEEREAVAACHRRIDRAAAEARISRMALARATGISYHKLVQGKALLPDEIEAIDAALLSWSSRRA
jgi:hypothetical protein